MCSLEILFCIFVHSNCIRHFHKNSQNAHFRWYLKVYVGSVFIKINLEGNNKKIIKEA